MRVAFVGLGAMGLPMARNLARKGHPVALFDVAPARLAEAAGVGRLATSVADALRDAEAVFTVLPMDRHVESVAAEVIAAAARPGLLFVDFSTIAPATIVRIGAALAPAGVRTVSVSLTRGTAAAAAGTLALWIGGDAPLAPALRDALGALATDLVEVDGLAAAKALKLANNFLLGAVNLAVSETLVLGRKLGLADRAVVDGLVAGADAWALRNQTVKHVLANDLGPGYFATRLMTKDVRLYLDVARGYGRPSYLAGIAVAAYRGVLAMGAADDYHPIVVRWLAAGAYAGEGASASAADATSLDVLVRGVAAAYVVSDLDALDVLAAAGVGPAAAARHLAPGSGANAALPETAATLARGGAVDLAPVTAALDAVSALADRADVPATFLETARQCAAARSLKKNSTQLA